MDFEWLQSYQYKVITGHMVGMNIDKHLKCIDLEQG